MRVSLPSIKCSAVPPSFDYGRALGNQIVEHSSVNETVLGNSRKLRGTAEHLIDDNEKRIYAESGAAAPKNNISLES